jgi:hypothetical protein
MLLLPAQDFQFQFAELRSPALKTFAGHAEMSGVSSSLPVA